MKDVFNQSLVLVIYLIALSLTLVLFLVLKATIVITRFMHSVYAFVLKSFKRFFKSKAAVC